MRLRVMSYNIHHAAGADGVVSPTRIAEVIREQRPDVVALQEVDVGTKRVDGVSLALEIAALTQMEFRFGKAIDFNGGAYGQAILSRYPLSDAQVHLLPGRADAEQRIALSTVVTLPGGKSIRVVSTHLDHVGDETDRLAQAAELNRLFSSDSLPTILAGDFNARPGSKTIELVQQGFRSASKENVATYPSEKPDRQIDWIFVRPGEAFEVKAFSVPQATTASDHLPVVAEMVLR